MVLERGGFFPNANILDSHNKAGRVDRTDSLGRTGSVGNDDVAAYGSMGTGDSKDND